MCQHTLSNHKHDITSENKRQLDSGKTNQSGQTEQRERERRREESRERDRGQKEEGEIVT